MYIYILVYIYIYYIYYIYILYIYYIYIHIYCAFDILYITKTHLFNKNISLSLQKLRQYTKNLGKHQTKIHTAINTK